MRLFYPLGVSLVLLLTGSAAARPLLRPAPELSVPAGWVAERYASGMTRPTAMAFGPDGRLYVAQEAGQILVVGVGSTKPRVLARGFPEALGLASAYAAEVPFYNYRHAVRPGISGWAAVYQGNVAEADAARLKLEYDFYYIKYFSIWLDFLIVIKTLQTVWSGFGSR